MPRWVPARSVPRMSAPRSIPALWGQAPIVLAIWEATARNEATHDQAPELEPELRGGLDPWQEQVWQTQAEMFVQRVVGRDEPGMTWRLAWLEAEMGLPDGARLGLSDVERRGRIIARLRGWRLPTAQAIRLVAQAYAGTDVQTSTNYPHHHLTVRFIGTALPENLEALKAEIIRISPARLGPAIFEVTFTTWGDMFEWGGTWGDLYDAGLTWQEVHDQPKENLPVPAQGAPAP